MVIFFCMCEMKYKPMAVIACAASPLPEHYLSLNIITRRPPMNQHHHETWLHRNPEGGDKRKMKRKSKDKWIWMVILQLFRNNKIQYIPEATVTFTTDRTVAYRKSEMKNPNAMLSSAARLTDSGSFSTSSKSFYLFSTISANILECLGNCIKALTCQRAGFMVMCSVGEKSFPYHSSPLLQLFQCTFILYGSVQLL